MSSPAQTSLGGCTQEQFNQVLGVLNGDTAAATVLCQVFTTSDRTEEVAFGLNTVFLLFSGALVFIMHGGFAMLEAGAIRSKNAMNILLQTILDGAASAIMWYLVGFGFAFGIGDRPNGFIGDALFAVARLGSHNVYPGVNDWTNWFYQWAFCATAATIPAGAVAERFNFNAYLGYSLFLGGFVYPVVVHWVWSPIGWLGYGNKSPLLGAGMIDFAGSAVVHMTGGLAGLIGATMVGPRLGRFDMNGRPVPMPGHSAILVVLGTVLLWFGWYGFNPGSALLADVRDSAIIAGRTAVTTTLSGAAGGLTCLVLGFVRHVAWDLISLCNGMLVGFVSVTAGCHVLEPWAAIICGVCAAMVFEGCCAALLRLRIDDVVSAGPMHGACGAFGVLFAGLLAKEEYVRQAYQRDDYPYGLFYGGGGRLLACQVIGVLAIAGWVAGTMGPFFLAFKLAGSLRISAEEEHTGLDVSKHGGSAYNAPGGHLGGGLSSLETLQQQLGAIAGGADPGVTSAALMMGIMPPPRQPHLIVHPGNHAAAKSVGDAIMRGNTMGYGGGGGGGSAHTGLNNPSSHYFQSSHHSQTSGVAPNSAGFAFASFAPTAAGSAGGAAGNGAVVAAAGNGSGAATAATGGAFGSTYGAGDSGMQSPSGGGRSPRAGNANGAQYNVSESTAPPMPPANEAAAAAEAALEPPPPPNAVDRACTGLIDVDAGPHAAGGSHRKLIPPRGVEGVAVELARRSGAGSGGGAAGAVAQ